MKLEDRIKYLKSYVGNLEDFAATSKYTKRQKNFLKEQIPRYDGVRQFYEKMLQKDYTTLEELNDWLRAGSYNPEKILEYIRSFHLPLECAKAVEDGYPQFKPFIEELKLYHMQVDKKTRSILRLD